MKNDRREAFIQYLASKMIGAQRQIWQITSKCRHERSENMSMK